MSTTDAPKKPRETDDVPVPATLRKSLKNRHIQLIALGGAIGTGLFYGSSESIALAGFDHHIVIFGEIGQGLIRLIGNLGRAFT